MELHHPNKLEGIRNRERSGKEKSETAHRLDGHIFNNEISRDGITLTLEPTEEGNAIDFLGPSLEVGHGAGRTEGVDLQHDDTAKLNCWNISVDQREDHSSHNSGFRSDEDVEVQRSSQRSEKRNGSGNRTRDRKPTAVTISSNCDLEEAYQLDEVTDD